jgi:hypothetical protein
LKLLDDLILDPHELPRAYDVQPSDVALLTVPWEKARKYDDALRFLLEMLRLHFDDEELHGKYIFSFLFYERSTTLLNAPPLVQPGTSVRIEFHDGDGRWVTIEDHNPSAARGEFASDHELSVAILGHAVGDEVLVPAGKGKPRKARVKEIQTKYVRQFQDSLEHFGNRFPSSSIIRHVNVGTPTILTRPRSSMVFGSGIHISSSQFTNTAIGSARSSYSVRDLG